jgi:hypothetical protein
MIRDGRVQNCRTLPRRGRKQLRFISGVIIVSTLHGVSRQCRECGGEGGGREGGRERGAVSVYRPRARPKSRRLSLSRDASAELSH